MSRTGRLHEPMVALAIGATGEAATVVLLFTLAVLSDFGLRTWFDEDRRDLLALHLLPLVPVYVVAFGYQTVDAYVRRVVWRGNVPVFVGEGEGEVTIIVNLSKAISYGRSTVFAVSRSPPWFFSTQAASFRPGTSASTSSSY